jgi:hypothetical protein
VQDLRSVSLHLWLFSPKIIRTTSILEAQKEKYAYMHCSFRKLIPMKIKQITVIIGFTSVFMWHRASFVHDRHDLTIHRPASSEALLLACTELSLLWIHNNSSFSNAKSYPCTLCHQFSRYSLKPRSFSETYSFLAISNLAIPGPTFKTNFYIRILS